MVSRGAQERRGGACARRVGACGGVLGATGLAEAPCGDARDEPGVDLAVGDANAALAVGVCAVQLGGKVLDRGVPWLEPDVVLVGGEVDEAAPLPVRGHAPGDPLLRVGKGCLEDGPHLEEPRLHLFRLLGDVRINGEGPLAAGVGLVCARELASALWALPHGPSLLLALGPVLVSAALGDVVRARGMTKLARETGSARDGL